MLQVEQEKHLIRLFVAGNRNAGEKLISHYYDKIANLATRVLQNSDDAKDVAQDVIYKVFVERKIEGFRGDARLGSWLFRITVNECKSLMGTRSRACVFFNDYANVLQETLSREKSNNPEFRYVNHYVRLHVRRAVDALDPIYRRGLTSIYFDEQSYKATSRELNVPMHTLGVRMLRGKKKLAQNLNGLKWLHTAIGQEWPKLAGRV